MKKNYGEYFNDRLYIEVEKREFRTYEIIIEILNDKIKLIYLWDYKATGDANICYLQAQVERAIINYFRR